MRAADEFVIWPIASHHPTHKRSVTLVIDATQLTSTLYQADPSLILRHKHLILLLAAAVGYE